MPRVLAAALFSTLVFMVLLTAGWERPGTVRAQTGAPTGVDVPPIPDPVQVSLDPTTTAFLALDFLESNCTQASRPACVASVPAVNGAIEQARAANVPIAFSYIGTTNLISQVVPSAADTVFATSGADKFFNTNLDAMLKQEGVTTLVITGSASNGAVLYTGSAAVKLGYTVVVAEDGISANTDFPNLYTEWQLLNFPGGSNAQNTPLQPKAVTLTRTDLITYR